MWRRIKFAVSKSKGGQQQHHLPDSSNQPTPFQYNPLSDPHDEIRLIKVTNVREPTDVSIGPVLEIEIFHTSLANAGSYVAVSYAWGDDKPVRRFICNGSELYTPENTFRALYTIFHASKNSSTSLYVKGETLTLWIDALCINQQDVPEKNAQVPLMGKIYQQAKGAIGYVGSPSVGTDPRNAIVSMAWWANCPTVQPPDDLPTDRTNPQFQAWLRDAQKKGVGEPPATIAKDLEDLWSNDWFMRCWVIQEMVLPPDVLCLYGYGDSHASWGLDTMTMLVERCQNVQHAHRDTYKIGKSFNVLLLKKAVQVDAWRLMRDEIQKQDSKRDFVGLLRRSRLTQARDQRDKIYSLFGLMEDEERAAIPIDYSPDRTVADVFMDVAKHCIPTLYGPRLLVEASISRTIPGLPSWAPDWTCIYRTALNTGIYNACASLHQPIKLLSDGRKIKMTGLKVESVAHVGIPVNYPHGVLDRSGINPATEPYSLQSILIAAAVLCEPARELYPRYPIRHEDWSDALRRTCAVDRHWSGRRLTAADRRDWDACLEVCGFGTDIFAAIKHDGDAASGSPSAMDQTSRQAQSLPYGIVVSEFQRDGSWRFSRAASSDACPARHAWETWWRFSLEDPSPSFSDRCQVTGTSSSVTPTSTASWTASGWTRRWRRYPALMTLSSIRSSRVLSSTD